MMHVPSAPRDCGVVDSVNAGRPQTIEWRGYLVTSSIWKSPISGPVAVEGVNVTGDDQADRRVHGGTDKAVYAYAAEDYEWWSERLGRSLGPGTFGDNLTVRGLDVTGAVVGERWRIGSVLLEVSQPRIPCYKLGVRMDDPRFLKRFAAAGRPGAYLRIVEPGVLAAGDAVQVVHRPSHGLTVADVSYTYFRNHDGASRFLEVPELSANWHEWARERIAKRAGAGTRRD